MGEKTASIVPPHWKLVAVDTNCFIYHLQSDDYPQQGALVEQLFRRIAGGLRAVTSVITVTEIMTLPRRLGLDEVAYQYKMLLVNFPNLEIRDVTISVADRAAALRARFGLKTPDALQIATGIVSGADCFITFDHDLQRVAEQFPIIVPDAPAS